MEGPANLCEDVSCSVCKKRIHRVDDDGVTTYHCGQRCHGSFVKNYRDMRQERQLRRLEQQIQDLQAHNQDLQAQNQDLRVQNQELRAHIEPAQTPARVGAGEHSGHEPASGSQVSPDEEEYTRTFSCELARPHAPRQPSVSSPDSPVNGIN